MPPKLRFIAAAIYILMTCLNFSACRTVTKLDKRDTKGTDAEEKAWLDLGWPIKNAVLFRTFDKTPSRLHEGLSFGAPANTSVISAQAGEVIFAGNSNNDLGEMVIIKHMDPFVTIYGHLDSILVKVGQRVRKGEQLGVTGSTGGAESPRVFFQLRKDRLPVNPELYLSKPG